MLKKYIYIAICALFCFGYTKQTKALFPDLTPLDSSPSNMQFDVPGAIASSIELVSSENAIETVIDNVKKKLKIDELEHHLKSYASNLVSSTYAKTLNKIAGKKVVSSSRLIDEKTSVKLDDEADIQKVFVERFLQYPSAKDDVKANYKKIGEQFKIDTTLEVYIVARETEIELNKKLEELDKIENCLFGGEDCDAAGLDTPDYNCQESKDSEDQMCLWRANLLIARIYDRIMWYNEFLLALDAQYRAAMAIEDGVKIREYKDEKNKTSSLQIFEQYQTAQISYNWGADFADLEWFDGSGAEAEVTTEGDFDIIDRAGGFQGAVAGKKESYDSMVEIEDANRSVEKALRAHNVKNKLSSFRRVYEFYHQAQDYLKKVNEHLTMSEECVHNYLNQYYQNGINAWVGHDCSIYSGGRMACAYSDGTEAGLGQFDVPCPQDSSKMCYVTEINDISNRSGLSGLLLERYNESKSLAASGEIATYETEEEAGADYVIPRSSSGSDKDDLRSNTTPNSDALESRGEKMKDKSDSKSPSIEEEMLEETRAANRLNWKIGAGVGRDMVADINGDGVGFGNIKSRYPLWNDQKEFYDQYINGKYANMQQYVASIPISDLVIAAARAANALIEYPKDPLVDLRQKEAKEIDELEESLPEENDNSLAELVQEEKEALNNLRQTHVTEMQKIQNKISAANTKIEKLNIILDSSNKKFNEQNKRLDYAETNTPQNEDNIRYEQEMYAKRGEKGGVTSDEIPSPYEEQFNNNIEQNNADAIEAEAIMEELSGSTAELEAQIEKLKEDIKTYQIELNNEIKRYVKVSSDTIRTYRDKVNQSLAEKQSSGALSKIVAAASEIEAVGVAVGTVECVRQKVIEKIKAAEEQMHQMQASNDIYYPENKDKILAVHQKMIDEIMSLGESVEVIGCGNMEDEILADITIGAIVDAIMSMCEGDYCTTPESDNGEDAVYFVSLDGKPRDFRAPTAPLGFAFPPLREIFYFDEQDYENVERYFEGDEEPSKSQDITITGEGFLNSGAEIPEIWKYILKVRSFEEKEFDIEKLFDRGNPQIALVRSGIFPCKYNGGYVDAALKNKNIGTIIKIETDDVIYGYNPQATEDNVIEQSCRLLGVYEGRLIDTESDYAELIPASANNVLESSELGQVLTYIEDPMPEILKIFGQKPQFKLSFNQVFLSAIKNVSNPDGIDEDDAANEQYKYAMRIMFVHNQFGDYLDFIDMKTQAEEMLERYKEQMQDIHQKLQDIFNEFGDTISEDFDLADENDYSLAEDSLEGYKVAFVRQTKEKLDKIRSLQTMDDIQEATDRLENKINLLELDEDEVTEISGSESIAELDFKIKQAKANNGIADEYNKKGAEEFEKQIRRLQKPYCAVYAK